MRANAFYPLLEKEKPYLEQFSISLSPKIRQFSHFVNTNIKKKVKNIQFHLGPMIVQKRPEPPPHGINMEGAGIYACSIGKKAPGIIRPGTRSAQPCFSAVSTTVLPLLHTSLIRTNPAAASIFFWFSTVQGVS